MRVRLGRINPGDPPSLVIEAETLDDTQILNAVADGPQTHLVSIGCSYHCSPTLPGHLPGAYQISISWFKKKEEAAPHGG